MLLIGRGYRLFYEKVCVWGGGGGERFDNPEC